MSNQLSVVIGVTAGVVVEVGVELRLRLWKLDAVDDVRVQQYLTGGDVNLCLHLHTVLWCLSRPGVATPSDGALRRHLHTLAALWIESGVEDASGERGLCVLARMRVRPLRRTINMEQWERGRRRSNRWLASR